VPADSSVYGVVVLDHSLDAHLLNRRVRYTSSADVLHGAEIPDEWEDVPFVAARRLAGAVVNAPPFAGNSAIVAVSEFATIVDPDTVARLNMAFLYGTNFHRGLVYARSRQPQRIVLIAYSAPTAHGRGPDKYENFFSFPPAPETLDLTRRELDGAVNDGARIDAVLIDAPARGENHSWTGRLHEINDLAADATLRSHGLLARIETPASDRVIADIVQAMGET
jgi:hypothetical protein